MARLSTNEPGGKIEKERKTAQATQKTKILARFHRRHLPFKS